MDRRYQGAGPASPPPVRPQACQCRPAVQNASRARTFGHGQVHVLPVAGDPGVERCRCERLWVLLSCFAPNLACGRCFRFNPPSPGPKQSRQRVRSAHRLKRDRHPFPWREPQSRHRLSELAAPWPSTLSLPVSSGPQSLGPQERGHVGTVEEGAEFRKVLLEVRSLPEAEQLLTHHNSREQAPSSAACIRSLTSWLPRMNAE